MQQKTGEIQNHLKSEILNNKELKWQISNQPFAVHAAVALTRAVLDLT